MEFWLFMGRITFEVCWPTLTVVVLRIGLGPEITFCRGQGFVSDFIYFKASGDHTCRGITALSYCLLPSVLTKDDVCETRVIQKLNACTKTCSVLD